MLVARKLYGLSGGRLNHEKISYLKRLSNNELQKLLQDLDPGLSRFPVDDATRETVIAMLAIRERPGK